MPRAITDAQVEEVVIRTLEEVPEGERLHMPALITPYSTAIKSPAKTEQLSFDLAADDGLAAGG